MKSGNEMIDLTIRARIEPAIIRIARWGFPWIHLLELAFWLTLMGAFFGAMGFLNAIPANLLGKSVPPSWEAAIPNHGELIRWYLKDNHPVAFGFMVFILLVSIAGMVLVHMAEARLRHSTEGGAKVEKAAVIALAAAVLLISYLVMTQLPPAYMVPAGLDGLSTGK
jgi:hypothetical protein